MTGPWWVVEHLDDPIIRAVAGPYDCEGAALLARIDLALDDRYESDLAIRHQRDLAGVPVPRQHAH